ncbi:TPA: response regulator transcription factor [Citrobacter freundii]|uniref:winged helix-turn-helix domain-containing protein n=1 Tax=Citrobacter farmeri TaxID=67824 RepID=UPI001903A7F1|nr:response regulator transcription factor [Citrobacter farmeri]HAT2286730.1 response regulator transcription factor [Citrobacter freundii]EKV7297278.1 response regulator transcription factor [Citrobacter farmeri]ELR9635992.1 response regulator transcription factor [Citrobacter farmeri]MBJ8745377.1 response regulator transcription factor [Citrobacter farmeri]MBJ8758628.1 response regulator transcription factor [Citrobacter farmeri]
MRLLLIGENEIKMQFLCSGLNKSGNIIDRVKNISQAEAFLNATHYCAIIILNPTDQCLSTTSQWHNKNSKFALISLIESREANERVKCFNLGLNDCIDFPVDIEELNARIHAAVRRNCALAPSILRHSNIIYNTSSREVKVNGEEVGLTPRELSLLEVFMMNKERILSRRYLEDKLCSWGEVIGSNVIEVHISSLRKKLGKGIIKTLSGQGYRLV